MSTLNHPVDGDNIYSILLAQGTLSGESLGIIARMTSYNPPQVRYAQQVQITPGGGWVALFTGLPVGTEFLLEVFDETGQLVGSASNLTVVVLGGGPQVLYPIDGQPVNHIFASYGIPEDADPLQCHVVEKGADSYPGTPIQYPGMFAFSFDVPCEKAGPDWTLKMGKAANCTGSTTVDIDIVC